MLSHHQVAVPNELFSIDSMKHSFNDQKVRIVNQKIDIAVSLDYGWKELDLRYDFYTIDHLPLSDQIRFTISEKSRIGLLKHLADLNLRRFSEEKLDNLPRASKSKKVKSL